MQTRHVLLTLLALAVAGGAAFGYLGWRRRLPPRLADAYGTVATLASSASLQFAPPAPDVADAAAEAAAPPPRIKQTAPLSSAQLGAPLVHGKYVSECGAPDTMKVVVKVTVKNGRAVGVKVTTTPPDPAVTKCVEAAAKAKEWDISPKTQHATVTY